MADRKAIQLQDGVGNVYDIKDAEAREELSSVKSALNFDKAATPGYIMTATNSGTGQQWSPVGLPTDEQTAEAVSAWLDDHPEAVTTVDFSIATKVFPTVADMVADLTLEAGDNVATRGYYVSGDSGGANYVISDSHSGVVFYIELANGLYANMLTDNSVIRAETIGIKAYAAETENPVLEDMDFNTEQFQKAFDNARVVVFGEGHFYFNDYISFTLRAKLQQLLGIDRHLSSLHFPSSDGIVFNAVRYYNHTIFAHLRIVSYGTCILCDEAIANLMDCHFEYLTLVSLNGNCFEAPTYNISKYEYAQTGRIVYDTAVQNAVFNVIDGRADNGAVFANIMGLGNQFYHLNIIGSTLYAFRNCDGRIEHLNTLGTGLTYFIYYDKTYSHSLSLDMKFVNAEGVRGAFIYTEPEVALAPGEDSKKPTNANIMTLAELICEHSGWSLHGDVVSDHDIYPITVHEIRQITLIGGGTAITPSAYPSRYDTDAVKGEIRETRGMGHKPYRGGKKFTKVATSSGFKYTIGGADEDKIIPLQDGGLTEPLVATHYDFLHADKLYGGKALLTWRLKGSELSYDPIQLNPPDGEFTFCDVIEFENDTGANKNISLMLGGAQQQKIAGKILTIINKSNSTGNIVLRGPSVVGVSNCGMAYETTLTPGSCKHFVLTYYSYNGGNPYLAWMPIAIDRSQEEVVTVSGSTPSVTGVAGKRYMCGTVSSISITPPASGIIEVFFTSGSTAAMLSIPRTVKLTAGLDPNDLDANTLYKVRITDGKYGEVTAFTEQPYVNLLDPSEFVDGKVWYNGNMLAGYSDYCSTPLIEVEPGESYYLNRNGGNQTMICYFDEEQTYISQAAWGTPGTKTIGEGVHYVGFSIIKADKNDALFAKA